MYTVNETGIKIDNIIAACVIELSYGGFLSLVVGHEVYCSLDVVLRSPVRGGSAMLRDVSLVHHSFL